MAGSLKPASLLIRPVDKCQLTASVGLLELVGRIHCHSIELLWSHMELRRISAIFRYPVKSMAGELLEVARLRWHGIVGDRRLYFRRLASKSMAKVGSHG
jgi:hypothetical protein